MVQISMAPPKASAFASDQVPRISGARQRAARELLHRRPRRRRIFLNGHRLARLQRLFGCHQACEDLYRVEGRRKHKGNMDIELAVDAMEMAPHIDQLVLFSGDGDFRSLVEAVNVLADDESLHHLHPTANVC